MKFVAALFGISTLVLTGCASNRYCLGEQDYQNAENLQPLQPVEGLKLPTSPTALKIPPPAAKPVAFGVANAKGDGVCLDKPPPMAQPPAPVATPATKPAAAPPAKD